MKATSSPKNGFSRVLGVVRLADLAARGHETRRADLQPAALEAREDLAGEVPLDGVGLDEDECALDGHAAGEASRTAACRGGGFTSARLAAVPSCSTGVSQ